MPIIFLRDENNDNVVDTEIIVRDNKIEDMTTLIDVVPYSRLLIKNLYRMDEVLFEFERIQEMRGWLFETQDMSKESKHLMAAISEVYKKSAKKYQLEYWID